MSPKSLGKTGVLGLSALAVAAISLAGCNTATGPSANPAGSTANVSALNRRISALEARVKTLEALSPGLGEFMLGFQMHFAKAYFAAEDGNWDLAKFELGELKEAADGAEASRPEDAAAIQGFVSGSLAPVQAAVKAKDKAAFETAYRNAVAACNACHASTIDRPKAWPHGRGFIKITVPTAPPVTNQDFRP